jgi:hypothetical protein
VMCGCNGIVSHRPVWRALLFGTLLNPSHHDNRFHIVLENHSPELDHELDLRPHARYEMFWVAIWPGSDFSQLKYRHTP